MKSLYLGSSHGYSGKTMLSIGIAHYLRRQGYRVGYFKPLGLLPVRHGAGFVDEDAVFVAQTLGLTDPLTAISPVVNTHELLLNTYLGTTDTAALAAEVKAAYKRVSRGKDYLLIGGAGGLDTGFALGIAGLKLVRWFGCTVVLVERYYEDFLVDPILHLREELGECLIGIVLNRVDAVQRPFVENKVIPFLRRAGLPVLGVIPEDQPLSSVTVAEVATELGGELIVQPKPAGQLINRFFVGAMSTETAYQRLRRAQENALITGGDRTDLQLAALETQTRCLILTGDLQPSEKVIMKAEEKKAAVILTRLETLPAVERLDNLLGRLKLKGTDKLRRAEKLVSDNLDWAALARALGARRRRA